MAKNAKHTTEREMTGEDFTALPDAEKERIWQDLDRMTPAERRAASRPLNAAERAIVRAQRAAGRPRVGAGAKVISISMERSLLDEANAFAKRQGVKRSELIATALRSLMRQKKNDRAGIATVRRHSASARTAKASPRR